QPALVLSTEAPQAEVLSARRTNTPRTPLLARRSLAGKRDPSALRGSAMHALARRLPDSQLPATLFVILFARIFVSSVLPGADHETFAVGLHNFGSHFLQLIQL